MNTETLTRIAPRVTRYARYLSQFAHNLEAADIEQQMWLAMLEREAVDHTFTKQKDAYMLGRAVGYGRTAARTSRTYSKYVGEETIDDQGVSEFEYIPAGAASPEEHVLRAERCARVRTRVAALPEHLRETAALLMTGRSKSEIAAVFGLTRAAITRRCHTIAYHLQAV